MTARGPSKTIEAALCSLLAAALLGACGLALDSEDRLARAEAAFDGGEYRAAIIDAKNVLLDEPDNLRARLVLGRASRAIGDNATTARELGRALALGASPDEVVIDLGIALIAEGRAEDALALFDTHPDIDAAGTAAMHKIRGDALLALSRTGEARDAYEAALSIDAADIGAGMGVAASYSAEGNPSQARRTLEAIIALDPQDPRVRLALAHLHAGLRNFEESRANFETAREVARVHGDTRAEIRALTGLVDVQAIEGDLPAAKRSVAKLDEIAPAAAETRLLNARIAYLEDDLATAERVLQALLNDRPDYPPALTLLGAVQLKEGKASQAEVYLSTAVARSPNDADARRLLAEARRRLDKLRDAQLVLDPLLAESVADARSLTMAARLSFESGDIEAASDYLQRSLEAAPDDTGHKLDVALAFISFGSLDRAEAVLRSIGDAPGGDETFRRDALRVLARIRAGDPDGARRIAKSLFRTDPGNPDVHNLLGSIELQADNYGAARVWFEEGARHSGNAVLGHRNLAIVDEAEGNYPEAAARYEQVLALEPDATWAMLSLARLAHEQGDEDAVETWLEKALSVTPDDVRHIPTTVMRVSMLVRDGDMASAMTLANELVAAHPEAPIPYALIGELHGANADFESASRAYDRVLAISPTKRFTARAYHMRRSAGHSDAADPLVDYLERQPGDIDVRLMLAEARMRSDDAANAIREYQRVLESDADNVIALNNLGWQYFEAGDPRALEYARRAYALNPEHSSIADTLGWILIRQGKAGEGVPIIERAGTHGELPAVIRFHLAAGLAALGRDDEARAILEELLSMDEAFPGRDDAEALLRKI